MNRSLRPLLTAQSSLSLTWCRAFHYKFTRTKRPPLQEPRESPYIVGPYLKPDYEPVRYITEPIKPRHVDDFLHFIYKPEKIEFDETRKIRLLLIKDVEGLGVAGSVVETPFRFGASKLVAMRRAEYYTDFAVKWHKFGSKTIQSASSALSSRTVRLLKAKVHQLPISKSVLVKPWHISLALRLAGCYCPIEAIDASSISEYSNEEGEKYAKCTVIINNHERVEVKFLFAKSDEKLDSNA